MLTETNFILDITFEQSQQCERLLSFALEQEIPVVVPEYSFAEAEGNIGNTLQKRFAAIDTAIAALKQSARSAYQDVTTLINRLEQFKVQSEEEERPVLHMRLNELENIVGGKFAFEADPIKAAHLMIAHIDKKRAALKLPPVMYQQGGKVAVEA